MQNVQFCCSVNRKRNSYCAHIIWFQKIVSSTGKTTVSQAALRYKKKYHRYKSIWAVWVKSAATFSCHFLFACFVLFWGFLFCFFNVKPHYFALNFHLSIDISVFSCSWCLAPTGISGGCAGGRDTLQGHPMHERRRTFSLLSSAVAQGLLLSLLDLQDLVEDLVKLRPEFRSGKLWLLKNTSWR